ncbi:DddA-like double-stranded DNA deaminase toxin [Allokutzneria sp. NRRL B-24872]|uniref:DddA-like double-stranded DNA deaminase toxin n=1 Tax=Allokutzneria sp. NRRL B-24872 TaxID=1137961 RepID=UPI000A371B7E|nr:DddA-like double-stranded DNA deaminase toxin [Allokutzneria sp. NRRL B-24872]
MARAARAAIAALPVQHVTAAEEALDEAATQWEEHTAGSTDPAAEEVHALLHTAKDSLDNLLHSITVTAPEAVRRWTAAWEIDVSTPTFTSHLATAGALPPRMSAAERAHRLEQTRQAMPPPVLKARASGAWVRPDGTVESLTSGKATPWFAPTQEWAQANGYAFPRGTWWLSVHIEMQFAIRMRAAGLTEETILVDRRPCEPALPGQDSCDTLLGDFLPEGARLTVIDRDGNRYTYAKEKNSYDA